MTENHPIPTELYRTIHDVMPIPCVEAVLVRGDGTFLLAKRTNKPARGQWWFPGGRILKNETFEKALARKMKQEINQEITVEKQLGVGETLFSDGPFDGATHTVNAVFLAIPTDPQKIIVLDSQADSYQWFSEIHEDWHPYVKKFLMLAGFTIKNDS